MISAVLRIPALALALGVLSACYAESEPERVEGYPGSILDARSPSGHAVASVVEAETGPGAITQVLLAFDGCGLGPVTLSGTGIGLEMSWPSDTLLEVRHPPDITVLGPPPDQRYDCGAGAVRVMMVPSLSP